MTTKDELVDLIKDANSKYAVGEPVISDREFDSLIDKLEYFDPAHPILKEVGATPTGTLIKHTIPVGSLEKIKTEKELMRWCDNCATHGNREYCIQYKLDGLTVVLYYKDGVLQTGATRGDGEFGEDITNNILLVQNVQRVLPQPLTGCLRGELVLPIKEFNEFFKPLGYANPRNTAAGKIRDQKATAELLKHFAVYWFDCVIDEHQFDSEDEVGTILNALGVESIPSEYATGSHDIWNLFIEMGEQRPHLDIEVDGIVIKANDRRVQRSMGMASGLKPKGQRCLKWEAVGGVTTLIDVELSIGHTGAIVPVGKVAPIEIGGVTITSVFLNNFEEIERLGIAIGDEIEIIRAGDVIPKCLGLVTEGKDRKLIVAPAVCMHCGEKTVKADVHIFCINPECAGKQFRLLKNWVDKRDIKYLGDELLQELFNRGFKRPQDLYNLSTEYLCTVTRGNGVVGTSANRIIEEIDKSRTATLPEFLGSLGIEMLGRRQVEIMMETCELSHLDDFMHCSMDYLEQFEGFAHGGSKAQRIVNGITAARETIEEMRDIIEITDEKGELMDTTAKIGKLTGKSVCFTGALPSGMKRKDAEALVEGAGGIAHSSVTKSTNYLVVADATSRTTKMLKAIQNGTIIIEEDELHKLLDL